jgi:hypothetical protein
MTHDLMIDLSDLDIEDVELLAHPGSRGMPEFAASCCDLCYGSSCNCSCTSNCATQPTQPAEG